MPRRLQILILSGALAGAACSSGHSSIDAAVVVDAAVSMPADAHPLCSSQPEGPEPLNWNVEVVWQRAIAFNSSDFDYGVYHVAADAEGISVFTVNSFIRTDVLGNPQSEKFYPEGRLFNVENGQGKYAAVFTENLNVGFRYLLCIVTNTGDLLFDDCEEIVDQVNLPHPLWDGQKYQTLAKDADKNILLRSYDATGAMVASRIIMPPVTGGGPLKMTSLGPDVLLPVIKRDDSEPCGSAYASIVPAGGSAGELRKILPANYESSRLVTASAPDSALVLTSADCSPKIDGACKDLEGSAIQVTALVPADGGDIDMRVARMPWYDRPELLWDGESYLAFQHTSNSTETNLKIYILGAEGQVEGVAVVPGPWDNPSLQLLGGRSAIGVLGPRNYILGYTVSGAYQHQLMRVRLSPP